MGRHVGAYQHRRLPALGHGAGDRALAASVVRGGTEAPVTGATHVDGLVAAGFEEVRAEFERNFAERGDVGAA